MAKKKYYDKNSGYAEGAGMLKSDKSAIANMPQDVKYVAYPASPYAMGPELNDNIKGVDYQMYEDSHGKSFKKGPYPEKY